MTVDRPSSVPPQQDIKEEANRSLIPYGDEEYVMRLGIIILNYELKKLSVQGTDVDHYDSRWSEVLTEDFKCSATRTASWSVLLSAGKGRRRDSCPTPESRFSRLTWCLCCSVAVVFDVWWVFKEISLFLLGRSDS
uniref:KIND domain-containing protein n=1 Tax=Steinernema glaseri TaxID=37863 RepID=A0A1I7Z133_9BILA